MIVKPDCADGSEGCGNEGAPLLVRRGAVKLVFILGSSIVRHQGFSLSIG
jgi:hypothetical protein